MRSILLGVASVLLVACNGPKIMHNTNKPLARFTATQSRVRPQVYRLDASDSVGTATAIASFKWRFGDEPGDVGPTVLTDPNTQHAYTAAGTYTITLVALDTGGVESEPVTTTVTVTSVNSDAPKAVLHAPTTGALNIALAFDGTGSTPANDLVKFSWNFGDPGAPDNTAEGETLSTVNHSFPHAGNFRVTLTVTDSLGTSDTAEQVVAVGEVRPTAVCTWSPMPALVGVPVAFDSSQSTAPQGSTVSLVIWNFKDGSPEVTGSSVTRTFNVQNTYRPHLKVLDSMNRLGETDCPEVVVGPAPACNGTYATTANPSMQSCGLLGTSSWGGNRFTFTQDPGGTMTATETFMGTQILYSGTWSGNMFSVSGTYDQASGGLTVTSAATIEGTFTGCGGWTGTYHETDSEPTLGTLCSITWNITGTKL